MTGRDNSNNGNGYRLCDFEPGSAAIAGAVAGNCLLTMTIECDIVDGRYDCQGGARPLTVSYLIS